MNPELPIGIFDSGVGGLTVVREIRRVLPGEDLVYLGDTARVPYGTKSPSTVVRFACEDTQFLVQQNVKARSEEHTSELQSRRDLVCRLLLEKKKKNKQ